MFFQNLQECIVLVMIPFVEISAAVSLFSFMFMILVDVIDIAINE